MQKGQTSVFIIIGVVVALAVGGIGYFVWYQNQPKLATIEVMDLPQTGPYADLGVSLQSVPDEDLDTDFTALDRDLEQL